MSHLGRILELLRGLGLLWEQLSVSSGVLQVELQALVLCGVAWPSLLPNVVVFFWHTRLSVQTRRLLYPGTPGILICLLLRVPPCPVLPQCSAPDQLCPVFLGSVDGDFSFHWLRLDISESCLTFLFSLHA